MLRLNLDKLYNVIKEYYPLTTKYDIKWHEEGYKLCKDMLKKVKDKNSGLVYAMNYYIVNFKESHLSLNMHYYFEATTPLYPGFYVRYDIEDNCIKLLESEDIISHIDDKPAIEYLKNYLLFNNGNDMSSYFHECFYMFEYYNNPYLPAPKYITLNNKRIKLKYKKLSKKERNEYMEKIIKYKKKVLIYPEYNISKQKNIINLTIDSFNTIKYDDLKKKLPCDKIVVDLRYNSGGDIHNVLLFFEIVYKTKLMLGLNYRDSLLCDYPKNEKCNIKKYKNEHKKPKLKILVNEFSYSACKVFCQIAKYVVEDTEIEGKIDLLAEGIFSLTIHNAAYTLMIPTVYTECKGVFGEKK
jgi:hypothetical protein